MTRSAITCATRKSTLRAIDEASFRAFHVRLLIYANAGLFCDGFILSSIGLALPSLSKHLSLSDPQIGFVGAATLLGIMGGALVFGPLTDRFGRRALMLADLSVFVIASLLQFFVTDFWQLVTLRLILGLAIGADYPIAGALISEYMPARLRGAAVNSMQVTWFLGATAAYVVGSMLFAREDGWRWILVSSAVPAAIGLALRATAPESVRWLLMRGRREEAHALLRSYFDVQHPHPEHVVDALKLQVLFRPPFLGRLTFVSAMWLLQVVPLFAIYTFAPVVLSALQIPASSPIGSVLITAGFLAGAAASMWLVEVWGRRPLCIAGFAVSAVVFSVVAHVPPALVVAVFMVYAVAIGAAAGLELVYPAELFSTSLRASATGFATAISRIGAFAGTFVLPIVLSRYGITAIMWSCALLSLIGLLVAVRFAPETRGKAFS